MTTIRLVITGHSASIPVMDFIRRSHLSLFGHIARLTQGIPAHNALHCHVGLASGRSLDRDWWRRPGRPRARWTDQLRNDTGSVPNNLWRQAILQGHGGERRRPELAMRWRRKVFSLYCNCWQSQQEISKMWNGHFSHLPRSVHQSFL